MLKRHLLLFLVSVLSIPAFAGNNTPDFSVACKTPPSTSDTAFLAPVVSFVGSGFKKGKFHKSWDFKGTLFIQQFAQSQPIRLAVEDLNLMGREDELRPHTAQADANTPDLKAAMTFWIPQALADMPKSVTSFNTTHLGDEFKTTIEVTNTPSSETDLPVYSDENANLDCAFTRTAGIKPGFWESLVEGVGDVGVAVLFPGIAGQ
jgi:hypothetical protein